MSTSFTPARAVTRPARPARREDNFILVTAPPFSALARLARRVARCVSTSVFPIIIISDGDDARARRARSTSSSPPRLAFGRRRDARDAVEYIGPTRKKITRFERSRVRRSASDVASTSVAVTTHPAGKVVVGDDRAVLRGKMAQRWVGGTDESRPVNHRHPRAHRISARHRIDD